MASPPSSRPTSLVHRSRRVELHLHRQRWRLGQSDVDRGCRAREGDTAGTSHRGGDVGGCQGEGAGIKVILCGDARGRQVSSSQVSRCHAAAWPLSVHMRASQS
jgi:hypothetical protein